MSARRVILLFIAALLVIAGAMWLSSQRQLDRAVAAGQIVLPGLKQELNDIAEVRLAKADGTHATLKKVGGQWQVAERNFAADSGRVRKLLLDLAALEVMEEKTSDAARYSAIGVEDVAAVDPAAAQPVQASTDSYDANKPTTATRVDVLAAGGKRWTLLAGKPSGAKATYTRVAGAKQSFLTTPRLELDAEPQSWLDKTIVDIPEARVRTVQVAPAQGPAYTVSRDKREQENFTVSPLPMKRKLSYEGVANSLARGLESVTLDDVQVAKGADASGRGKTIERSKATYRTFDGITIEVAGRKESSPGLNKDDPRIEKFVITLASASSDPATQPEARKLEERVAGREFEISSYKYEGIFKPLEDLLEALPDKSAKD